MPSLAPRTLPDVQSSPRGILRGAATPLGAGVDASNTPGTHLVPRPPQNMRSASLRSVSTRARWERRAESPVSSPRRIDLKVVRAPALPHVVEPSKTASATRAFDAQQNVRATTVPASQPGRPLSPFFNPAATIAQAASRAARHKEGSRADRLGVVEGSTLRRALTAR